MKNGTIYNYLNQVVFEGRWDDCLKWLKEHKTSETISMWHSEDGYTYYNIGETFHTFKMEREDD